MCVPVQGPGAICRMVYTAVNLALNMCPGACRQCRSVGGSQGALTL